MQKLCNNCGLLYERDRKLPPWNRNLFASEKNAGTREAALPQSYNTNNNASMMPLAARPITALQSDLASFPTHHQSPPPSLSRQMREDINPSSHLYTGASAASGGGQGQISASTMADIINYAEPGEDLDWTKVTEPRERKRLQNIINGRKYRERRLAAEGQGGSGGNYPGAAGVGSFLSTGYGSRQSSGQGQQGQRSSGLGPEQSGQL